MTAYIDELLRVKEMQKVGKVNEDENPEELAKKLLEWRKSDDEIDKQNLVEYGSDKDLDTLVHNKNAYIRQCVAEQGRDKDLDILVNDPDWGVRLEVASWGRDKDLDKLVYDKNESVREAVAYQGELKHLEILANDDSTFVLQTVTQRLLELLDEQKTGQFSERIWSFKCFFLLKKE